MSTNTKGVAVFLVLAFGIAWLLWEIPLWLGVPFGGNAYQLAVVPGAFAPAIAAIIVRKWVTREGFADAGLRLNLRKWPYYVAAWLIPLGAVAFVAMVAPMLGLSQPDYSLQNGAALAQAGRNLPLNFLELAVLQMSVSAVIATPILWGEEFGWRSYLQLRLFQSRPLLAAIATGIIWGVWHFPLLARGSEFPLYPYLSLAIFPLGTVLYSIIFGWLRTKSESIWASSFAHSAINNLGVSLRQLLFASQADLLPIALLGLVPLALFAGLLVLCGELKPTERTSLGKHASS